MHAFSGFDSIPHPKENHDTMKRTRLTPLAVLAALLLCLSCAGAAQASAIVDTGPVSAGGTRVSDWTLNYTQWLGSEFTVGGPTRPM